MLETESTIAKPGGSEGTLDPVTFEVLKNAFRTSVDLMAEQILRTCHSFVIYARDFSSALCDAEGNTVMQGSQDIAVHVGTLHFKAKAVIEAFGDDIHDGDVFVINDPYAGGTHFNDVSVLRPVFYGGRIVAYTQSNGHWADMGGTVPGSFDVNARDHFGEGVRVPPTRLWSKGVFLGDAARLILLNTRAPADAEGDLRAQAEATRVGARELLRLIDKYGIETVEMAFEECQEYVNRLVRNRVADLPDGVWETEDFLDQDPILDEGLIPIKVRMEIAGDQLAYDLTGSHACVASFLNSSFGASASGVIAGTKMFFPDLPLNGGFYRAVSIELGPEGSVVHAPWPVAVTGYCAGPYEKIVNSCFELWSELMPERAMSCSFNLEYLLVGGNDDRRADTSVFMWYDWMAGGWGARNGKDGSSATAPVFGAGLALQPIEGQERLCPVITTSHKLIPDSAGPGTTRGGLGVSKGATIGQATKAVMSYCSDRSRSLVWGMQGGLPSYPHGVWLDRATGETEFLGAGFSNVPLHEGDRFWRPSAGGGGLGDPLERDPQMVLDDVKQEYVTVDRASKDYGVVIVGPDSQLASLEVDQQATNMKRAEIRGLRREWAEADPDVIARRFREKDLSMLDLARQYAVIVDWNSGELFEKSTAQFRESFQRRTVAFWTD